MNQIAKQKDFEETIHLTELSELCPSLYSGFIMIPKPPILHNEQQKNRLKAYGFSCQ